MWYSNISLIVLPCIVVVVLEVSSLHFFVGFEQFCGSESDFDLNLVFRPRILICKKTPCGFKFNFSINFCVIIVTCNNYYSRAMEMNLTGVPITAQEAASYGLVSKVTKEGLGCVGERRWDRNGNEPDWGAHHCPGGSQLWISIQGDQQQSRWEGLGGGMGERV